MVRLIISIVLVVAGVLLAQDIGNVAGKMSYAVTRNPATIAITGYVYENATAPVFAFEQDLLVHFTLAPYFIIAGGLAGLAIPVRYAIYGCLLPLAYAVWLSVLLIQMAGEMEGVTPIHFLDEILTRFALVPAYVIGVNLGRGLNERRPPRWNLVDCIGAMTIFAVLSFAIVYRPFMLIPATMVTAICFVAWRTSPAVHGAAEQSGEREPPMTRVSKS